MKQVLSWFICIRWYVQHDLQMGPDEKVYPLKKALQAALDAAGDSSTPVSNNENDWFDNAELPQSNSLMLRSVRRNKQRHVFKLVSP